MIARMQVPLFLPATKLDRLDKAQNSGADAIILDLEDAVAPADKAQARVALSGVSSAIPLILRVNAIGTQWHDDDLAFARASGISAVMLPKAEAGARLDGVVAHLAGLPLIALVETAEGIASAQQIAATAGVARMAFGSIDYCADLDCAHSHDALLFARSSLVLASRLARKPAPFDGVTADVRDLELTAQEAQAARDLGMGGKLLIHPAQVGPALQAFRPSAAQLDWARRVMAAPEGVSLVDGEMVDAPVRLRAAQILARAT